MPWVEQEPVERSFHAVTAVSLPNLLMRFWKPSRIVEKNAIGGCNRRIIFTLNTDSASGGKLTVMGRGLMGNDEQSLGRTSFCCTQEYT